MENKVNISEEFPLISFIMPVYNDGKEVEKAITSILDQDWPSIEVIAVNDGSTDNSKKVLDTLAKKHKNLTVLHFDKNKGACVARNEGAKIARTHNAKYYAWLPADAKLYPGVARIWVESLERNPECDFFYGGYRFVDNEGNTVMNYMGDELVPYLLEVSNYIDGSFPIRADAFWRVAGVMNQPDGLWDSNVKSLQDWDFWLSVIKEGKCKGIYFPDIYFETTLPHAGGLSYDSHANWLARTNAIKRKHNIPDRKICVTAPGAKFFGKYIAYLLDADFKEMPPAKDHDYDLIYEIGYYSYPPEVAEASNLVFADPKAFGDYKTYVEKGQNVPLANAIKVVHLIGTDLLQMSDLPRKYLPVFQYMLNGIYDQVFTEFKESQKEAKELGIKTDVLPIPPRKYYDVSPFPEKFTVAVYAPEVNQSLYNTDLMEQVAKKLPEFQFKFFGNRRKVIRDGNIDHIGYVRNMDEFIKDCSCLIRITSHDGLAQSVLEFLSAGRRVVYNHDFKNVNTANKQMTVEALVKALKEESKKGLDEKSAKWIRREFSKEKFKEKIYSLLKYDAKKYWENRAPMWIKAAEVFYTTKDWDKIVPYVKDIDPTSIIDIGCGDGQWAKHFEGDYLGIDISETLVKHAQKKHKDKAFQTSSLEDFKSDKKYDLAFCYTVFEHIPEEDMEKAVEALKKIAKKAILVEPTNIKTKYYCHNHEYSQWFKIIKEEQIGPRKLMVVDLV